MGESNIIIFSKEDQLSIETENNVNGAKFLIYPERWMDQKEAEAFLIQTGIMDIITRSASSAIVMNPADEKCYTDADIDLFLHVLKEKIGPCSNLNVVGIQQGASFVLQKLHAYNWSFSGIFCYGADSALPPKYPVPAYFSQCTKETAEVYRKRNHTTEDKMQGSIRISFDPSCRFHDVAENTEEEDIVTAFHRAWKYVLSRFARIGNIERKDGNGTWYEKTNEEEREFQFFDSVDAIHNVKRFIHRKDLNGNRIDSLWYVYMNERCITGKEHSLPAVFLMHGNHNDPRTQWDTSGWANIASKEDVVLVCPEWQGHTYQGYTYDPMTSDTNYTPDSKFIRCVKEVLQDYPVIDPSRLYISGLSKGCRNTTNNAIVNTKYFAAAAGQSGPFLNDPEQLALLKKAVDKNSLEMPIIYFSGDKDEYLIQDFDVMGMTGALQIANLFQTMNHMPVTKVTDLKEEYSHLYGIPFDEFKEIENEGLCRMLSGTMRNKNGVELSFVRIKDWGHWNYPPDAQMMWDFMKKYRRDPLTGKLSIII